MDEDDPDGFRMDFSTWSDPTGTYLHTHQFTVYARPGTCPYCFHEIKGDKNMAAIDIRWDFGEE